MSTIATTTVTAESAPIGQLLWPVRAPKYAPNFTLATVTINEIGNVVWTYQNGTTRTFRKGEKVAVAA